MAGLYAMLVARRQHRVRGETSDTVAANAIEVKPTTLCGVPRFFEKSVRAGHGQRARTQPPLRQAIFRLGHGKRHARGARPLRAAYRPWAAWDAISSQDRGSPVGPRFARVSVASWCAASLGGAAARAQSARVLLRSRHSIQEAYGLTETSPVICLNSTGA
jgi:long-chain acyl-CoA synthetase